MKAARSFCLVFVTTPDLKVARRIARIVLKARLAACANLVPGLESHYWWQGKLERAREVLIMFKASRANLSQLENSVIENHPYDTPEVISFSLQSGNAKYLRWLMHAQRKA